MAFTFNVDVTHSAGKVLKTNKIQAPTASGGSTYGNGSNGQFLLSNGTTTYWGFIGYDETDFRTSVSSDVISTIGVSGDNPNHIIGYKYAKYKVRTGTAAADSWSSTSPPTQSIAVSGVSASELIQVGLANTATAEQIDAAAAAKLMCTAQANNSITITAYGTTPTVNIPILVISWG